MALATAAPMIPSTIFIKSPISLFINCSASQPATPPMIMAAIQPTCGSFIARPPQMSVEYATSFYGTIGEFSAHRWDGRGAEPSAPRAGNELLSGRDVRIQRHQARSRSQPVLG